MAGFWLKLVAHWAWFLGPLCGVASYFITQPVLSAAGANVVAIGTCMIFWWITERVPLALASLLPAVFLPLATDLELSRVLKPYFSDVIFLFFGGFVISRAMEIWGIHERIAIRILLIVGSSYRSISFGLLVTTALLSLVISNSATAMMMLPIALGVLNSIGNPSPNYRKAILLGIAYGASVGGTGSLIGSPTNPILAGYFLENGLGEISFAAWLGFGLPFAFLSSLLLWLLLNFVLFRYPQGAALDIRRVLEVAREDNPLGSIGRIRVGWVCAIVALAWILHSFLPFPWITDARIAVAGALLLFLIPSGEPELTASPANTRKMVLTIHDLRKIPWAILLMFGGGLSLSYALQNTGVAAEIARSFEFLSGLPGILNLFIIVLAIILITEFASNTAVVALFVPLLAGLGDSHFGLNQRQTLIAITFAASLSFMMPMATPPNAIIYAQKVISMRQMMRAGLVLNICFAVLITLYCWFVFA